MEQLVYIKNQANPRKGNASTNFAIIWNWPVPVLGGPIHRFWRVHNQKPGTILFLVQLVQWTCTTPVRGLAYQVQESVRKIDEFPIFWDALSYCTKRGVIFTKKNILIGRSTSSLMRRMYCVTRILDFFKFLPLFWYITVRYFLRNTPCCRVRDCPKVAYLYRYRGHLGLELVSLHTT